MHELLGKRIAWRTMRGIQRGAVRIVRNDGIIIANTDKDNSTNAEVNPVDIVKVYERTRA